MPAVGIAPELVILSLAFMALAMALTLRGVRVMWAFSFGAILEELYTALTFNVLGQAISLGGPFRRLDRSVQNAILGVAEAFDAQAGRFWHGAAILGEWIAKEIEHVAKSQYAFAEWVLHVHLPKWVKATVEAALFAYPFERLIKAAVHTAVAALRPIVTSVTKTATTEVYRLPKQLRREISADHVRIGALAAAVAALAGSLTWPHGISLPNPGALWRGLTRRMARAERRLARLEALLGVAGFAAIMAKTLGIPNWRCLTRGPLGRLSRFLCGAEKWLVDLRILGSVEAFVVGDLCDFSALLIKATEEMRPALLQLVNVEDALVGCHEYTAPPNLNLPALSLPPMPGTSALAV